MSLVEPNMKSYVTVQSVNSSAVMSGLEMKLDPVNLSAELVFTSTLRKAERAGRTSESFSDKSCIFNEYQ